jgi:hypothetical protein
MGSERENFVTRRAAFKPIAAAAFASAAVIPAVANAQPSSELHTLWNKRRAIRPVYLQGRAAIKAAEDALPWWAQTGPMYLAHDGTFTGIHVGWPAIRELEPSEMVGVLRLARPSQHDLRKDYEQHCSLWGDSASARARYRDKLRKFAVRRREQKAEEQKVGLPALEKQHEAVVDGLVALNDAIETVSDQTADAVAASLLVELNYEGSLRDNTGVNIQGIARALRILLPSLTGNIAVDVADLLDNPDTPITERAAWIG